MTVKNKILIVDDSETIRKITMRIIEDLGLEALEAGDAGEALNLVRSENPAVVFLDWDLPSLGALDYLKDAATIGESDRPEVVLCATENDPQQFTLAKAAGAAHHVMKPYDRQIIEGKLADLGIIDAADLGGVSGEQSTASLSS